MSLNLEQGKKKRLSELLFAVMKERRLSRRKLAELFGLNSTSVNNYLQMTSFPTESTREVMAVVLGMTPRQFEAYLNDVPVKPLQTAEQIKEDLKSLSQEEFLQVAEVVMGRLLLESRQQAVKALPPAALPQEIPGD